MVSGLTRPRRFGNSYFQLGLGFPIYLGILWRPSFNAHISNLDFPQTNLDTTEIATHSSGYFDPSPAQRSLGDIPHETAGLNTPEPAFEIGGRESRDIHGLNRFHIDTRAHGETSWPASSSPKNLGLARPEAQPQRCPPRPSQSQRRRRMVVVVVMTTLLLQTMAKMSFRIRPR